MEKLRIILTLVLFIAILYLAACSTGHQYHTYQLPGKYHYYESRGRSDYRMYVNEKEFEFSMYHESIDNGTYTTNEFHTRDRYIYIGPYDLSMKFIIYNYAPPYYDETPDYSIKVKKIIVNKMLFQSKNNTIDLREKVAIKGKQLNEKELINFKNSGVIDLEKIGSAKNNSNEIHFIYEDVNVAFKHDESFTIEYDITFETSGGTKNYIFTAPFNRARFFTEKVKPGERIGFCCFASCLFIGSGCGRSNIRWP